MKKERKRNLLPVKLSIHGMFLIGFNMILLTLCLEYKVGTKRAINKAWVTQCYMLKVLCKTFYQVNYFSRKRAWTAPRGPWRWRWVWTATTASTAPPWCCTPAPPSGGTSGQCRVSRMAEWSGLTFYHSRILNRRYFTSARPSGGSSGMFIHFLFQKCLGLKAYFVG